MGCPVFRIVPGNSTIRVQCLAMPIFNCADNSCAAFFLHGSRRWKKKNGIEDLKKIEWYLKHLIKHVEKKEKSKK